MRTKRDNSEGKISNYSKNKYSKIHSQKAKLGVSILQKHDEKMSSFNDKEKRAKEFKKEIDTLTKFRNGCITERAICEANNKFNESLILSRKIKDTLDSIDVKKRLHDDFMSGKLETEYILSVLPLVTKYYELEEEEQLYENRSDMSKSLEQNLFEINTKKQMLTEEYLKITDPTYIPIRNNLYTNVLTICEHCNGSLSVDRGFAVCTECGSAYNCIHEASELSYKEAQEFDYRSQFTYDKRTHLLDWLRRFQAKESKEIPQDILDKVVLEAKKERIVDLNSLTETKVKAYLKKLNLNDYYDNVISIINRINKRQPFALTKEIEHKIMEMFQQIQEPFEKFKDVKRKNMLSYSFILNKFFLILGLPEFSKYFFLLKSPDKLRAQDETFKKIVDHMAKIDPKTPWSFTPSI